LLLTSQGVVERHACSNWPNAWSIVSFSSARRSAGIKIISPNSASRFIIGIETRSAARCKAVQDFSIPTGVFDLSRLYLQPF